MNSLLVPKENITYVKPNIEAEIERLIDEYGNDVLRISYLYLKDRQRAEDAFQEVFLKVYKKYESFQGKSSEKTWIIKITMNVCKDLLRSSWIRKVFPSENIKADNIDFDVSDRVIQNDHGRILLSEVMKLSKVQKDVIILHYYEGFDTVEISKTLGVPEGTVRSRLFRAREALKKRIDGRIEYCD